MKYLIQKSILPFCFVMLLGYSIYQYFTLINLKSVCNVKWTLCNFINSQDYSSQKRINFLINNTCFPKPYIEISNYHFNGIFSSIQIRYKFFSWIGGSKAYLLGKSITKFAESNIPFSDAPIPNGCYDTLPYADKYLLTRLFSSPSKIIQTKNILCIQVPKTGIIFQFTNKKKDSYD